MSDLGNLLIDIGMYITYGLIAFATLTAILFPVVYTIRNPKKAGSSVIGILAIIGIYVVSYIFSTGKGTDTISEGLSHHISAALLTTYILIAIALLLAVLTSFIRLRK